MPAPSEPVCAGCAARMDLDAELTDAADRAEIHEGRLYHAACFTRWDVARRAIAARMKKNAQPVGAGPHLRSMVGFTKDERPGR